jgi:hypothetical protein
MVSSLIFCVIPAWNFGKVPSNLLKLFQSLKAGIQKNLMNKEWIPVCTGMTKPILFSEKTI